MGADDERFGIFVRAIRSDRALMNMSGDGGAIILNGIAAVTGTAGEKAALSALSGGLLAAKGSVDRELFNLEAMSALLARMRAAREAARVPIFKGVESNTADYPLEKALVDLRAYAEAGSLLATIDAIKIDAGKVVQEAQAEITRDKTYRDSLDRRDALGARLLALSDAKILKLANNMDRYRTTRSKAVQQSLDGIDNGYRRFVSGANAKIYMQQWLRLEDGTTEEFDQWDTAITTIEEG